MGSDFVLGFMISVYEEEQKGKSMMLLKFLLRFFSLATIVSIFFFISCSSNDEPKPLDCNTSGLQIAVTNQVNPTSCIVDNGSITVSASGGSEPYQFKLNNGSFGNSATFSTLGGGSFTVTVKDKNGCEKLSNAILLIAPSGPMAGVSSIAHQTNCLSPNGSITVNVTGGSTPYQYKIGSGSFGSSPTFTNLVSNNYTVTVLDNAGCSITINEVVESNTGISYATQIKPILEANCIKSGCHNGDNGADRNWSIFANVQTKAQGIKTRTANKSMPQDIAPTGLPENEIKLIACWVDEGAKNN